MMSASAATQSELAVALQAPSVGHRQGELCEFFRVRFGSMPDDAVAHGIFPTTIDPIEPGAPDEVWYTVGSIKKGEADGIRYVRAPHFLAIHLQTPVLAETAVGEVVYEAYARLILLAQRFGYPHLVRTWNYLPDINLGRDDNERYKQFSVGRGRAFDEFGYREPNLPAGTAVGSHAESPLRISLMTSASACRAVENPRQTNAYQYPRQYGPRSPSFSRAIVIGAGNARQLLISGTASIVGSESRHDGSLEQQIKETVRNIKSLVEHGAKLADKKISEVRSTGGLFRVYLRRSSDIDLVKQALSVELGYDSQVVFLRGDMCRRELDLEIEGVFPL